jgi:competence protein ComEA
VTPSGAVLLVDFGNRGNALAEDIVGNVTLSQGDHALFSRRLEMTSFLPETAVAYPFPFARTPAEDTYALTGSFQVGNGPRQRIEAEVPFGSDQADEFEEETGREPLRAGGISSLVVCLILLASGALGAAIVLRRRGFRGPDANAGKVDLNTAGVEELATLPGIGRRAALRIVDHREEYGRFRTVAELEMVDGFDADRVRGFKEQARV